MREYTLDPRLLGAQLRARIALVSIMFFLVFAGVMFLCFYVHPAAEEYRNAGPVPWIVLLGLFVSVLAFQARSFTRTARTQWDSFRLVVDEESVSRHVAQLPPVIVRREDVKMIGEVASTHLALRAADGRILLAIPASLIGYDEVRATLGSWCEIRTSSPAASNARGWARLIAILASVLGAFGVVIGNENPFLFVPTGVVLVVLVVAGIVTTQRNASLDARTKWMAWIGLLPALSIAGIVVCKLLYLQRR